MNTLVLNAETSNLPIGDLLKQAESGGVELRDTDGNLVALVLSPSDLAAWTYAEANLDLNHNLPQVREALAREGGVTTTELLEKAAQAADQHDAAQ